MSDHPNIRYFSTDDKNIVKIKEGWYWWDVLTGRWQGPHPTEGGCLDDYQELKRIGESL